MAALVISSFFSRVMSPIWLGVEVGVGVGVGVGLGLGLGLGQGPKARLCSSF